MRYLLPLCAALCLGAAQAAEPAAWTLLCYMDSDNDLEASQLADLEEMAAAEGSAAVNVIVLSDRAENDDEEGGYSGAGACGLKPWDSALLLNVRDGRAERLADWGEVNMGDPATLARFVATGLRQFPAERVALIIQDHGAAWPGACSDESHEDDLLTVPEMTEALEEALGERKLDLLGFDCCLMANLETAYSFRELADIMVASEELEPGSGWAYTPLLEALAADPAMTAEAFGRTIATSYRNYFRQSEDPDERSSGHGVTLSVVRLARVAALAAAVDRLAGACRDALEADGREFWLALAEARSEAEEYGRSGALDEESGSAVYDLCDLTDALVELVPETAVARAAEAVTRACAQAVAFEVSGKARPGANGLSVYFAPDAEAMEAEDQPVYSDLPFADRFAWDDLLADYHALAAEDAEEPVLSDVEATLPDNDEEPVVVTGHVKADDLDEASFVVATTDGEETLVLGQLPTEPDEDGQLRDEFHGAWFTLGDGEGQVVCPITGIEPVEDDENACFAVVPAAVKKAGSNRWRTVTLYFWLDLSEETEDLGGELVYAFRESRLGQVEVELEKGDQVRPLYLLVDADGEESLISADDPDDFLNIGDPADFCVGFDALDAGTYLLGYLVSDLAGNLAEELVEVEVE